MKNTEDIKLFESKARGIEVNLLADFSIVRETLERVGIKNENKKTLYPSCYIISEIDDEGETRYFVVHFKQLFIRDGKEDTLSEHDILRLKTIVYLLVQWGLVEVVDPNSIDVILRDKIDVISHKERNEYNIVHKYVFTRKVDASEIEQ